MIRNLPKNIIVFYFMFNICNYFLLKFIIFEKMKKYFNKMSFLSYFNIISHNKKYILSLFYKKYYLFLNIIIKYYSINTLIMTNYLIGLRIFIKKLKINYEKIIKLKYYILFYFNYKFYI